MSKETLTQIVSGSSWKKDAFMRLDKNMYPGSAQYDEKALSANLPMTSERAGIIAELKALKDVQVLGFSGAIAQLVDAGYNGDIREGTSLVRVYTDVVQMVNGQVLEKPHPNLLQWIRSEEALIQSGQPIEIITAISGIDVTQPKKQPHTVYVRVKAHMRHYTKEDLISYARHGGVHNMLNTAGGLSLANGGRKFYDDHAPLTVYLHESLDEPGVQIAQYTNWQDISNESLLPAITGAYPEAFRRLVEKCIAPEPHSLRLDSTG